MKRQERTSHQAYNGRGKKMERKIIIIKKPGYFFPVQKCRYNVYFMIPVPFFSTPEPGTRAQLSDTFNIGGSDYIVHHEHGLGDGKDLIEAFQSSKAGIRVFETITEARAALTKEAESQ